MASIHLLKQTYDVIFPKETEFSSMENIMGSIGTETHTIEILMSSVLQHSKSMLLLGLLFTLIQNCWYLGKKLRASFVN